MIARLLQLVRIVVELLAVVGVAAWGLWSTSGPIRWLVGLICAVVFMVVWGRFVAPRSPTRCDLPARLVVEIMMFGIASAAIGVVIGPMTGAVFAAIALLDALALSIIEVSRTGALSG